MPRKTDPKNLERVLDAAAELFLAEGYDAATMQQLADKLGLHKSSLYHYVTGKEDLLEQLTHQAQEDAEAALLASEQDPDVEQGYLEAIGLAVDQTISDIGRVSLVLRQKPGTPTGDAVVERRREYDRRVSKLIEEAQAAGQLRDDIHPMLLSRLTLGMVSWLIEWYDPELSRFDPETLREAVLAVVSHGVVTARD